jgi:ribonucleoside-diphosphate reductase beta chain
MTSKFHSHFSTTTRGLDRNSPPMRLFEKAKLFGIWNPTAIDLEQDKVDWQRMGPDEQDIILRLTSLFQAGEEAVTLDLLPLMMAIANEGRIEEEMFLTTFLWEEAKHTDFFSRFLSEVVRNPGDLSRFHTPSYTSVFYETLPQSLGRLQTDPSPQSQVVAAVTYNMIVEGVLAETGYYSYYTALRNNNLMPGTCEGIDKLKQDESRHIAYGVYLISRLVSENPDLWDVAESTMNILLIPALGVVNEAFASYNPIPFGLNPDDFTAFALSQFQKRYNRIAQARETSLEAVQQMTLDAIEQNDA